MEQEEQKKSPRSPRTRVHTFFKKLKLLVQFKKVKINNQDVPDERVNSTQTGHGQPRSEVIITTSYSHGNLASLVESQPMTIQNIGSTKYHFDDDYKVVDHTSIKNVENDSYLFDLSEEYNSTNNNDHFNGNDYDQDDSDDMLSIPVRRFTIDNASPLPELYPTPVLSPKTIKRFIPNEKVESIFDKQLTISSKKPKQYGHVRYESIHFKPEKQEAKKKQKQEKCASKKQNQKSTQPKERLNITPLSTKSLKKSDSRNLRQLDYYIATLYPGFNFESILNVRFYLNEEYTLLTPICYTIDSLYISRQYIDVRLLNETMLYLFDYEGFDCEEFLNNEFIRDYGTCICIQIGYRTKMIVLSFESGFNLSFDKNDILRLKNGIY